MADNIRGIINVKTEGGKTLYKVKERSSTESRWIESDSSELSLKHILAFEQKQKERKEAKTGKRSRDDEPMVKKAKLTVETVSGWLCCLHNIITAAPLTFFKISSIYRRCLPQ